MRILLLLFFVCNTLIKVWCQSYTTVADSLFQNKNYKEAIGFYKKVVTSKNTGNEELGKCNWKAGQCYYNLNKTDSALFYYHNALKYYRSLNDWSSVGSVHTDISTAHSGARALNLKWSKPPIQDEVLKEVYFKISKVIPFDKDSLTIEVEGGSYDGVINSTGAKCIGAVKSSKDRVGWFLANGRVISVKENKTVLKAELLNNTDSLRQVLVGDVASLYCKYGKNKKSLLLQELGEYGIFFLDNYKSQYYHWRDLLNSNDEFLENDIYQKMRLDILEIYDLIKDDSSYSELASKEGLFAGEKMISSLKNTTVWDIRAFLQFVKAYPGKYAGIHYKFSETYATWLLNNSPTAANAMVDYYLHQPDKTLRANYISNYQREIYSEKYFNTWRTDVLKNIKQNNLFELVIKLDMLKDAGELFKDKEYMAWYYYCKAKYNQKVKDTSNANPNFRNALQIFSTSGNNEGIYLCNEALKNNTKGTLPEIVMQNAHNCFFDMSFSPDGKFFVTGADDKTIKLWDARLGKEIITVKGHDDEINCVAFSYDGRYIISGSKDKTVKLWDADNLKLINTFHTGISNSKVLISKNASFFIVCGRDSIIQMWDIAQNKLVKKFSKHKKRVSSLCWGNNEKEFYSCGSDSFVNKWDITTNEMIHWYNLRERVNTIQISPDGRWMSCALNNGKATVWDLNNNKIVYSIPIIKSYDSDSTTIFITEPVFSNDSRYLIYGKKLNQFVITELATGDGIRYKTNHYMDILSIIMSDDGSFFATIGRDFKINLFDFKDYSFDTRFNFKSIEIDGNSESGSMVSFNNDNNLLIYGGAFRNYNLNTGKSESLKNYIGMGTRTNSIFDKDYKNIVSVNYYLKCVFKFNLETKLFDTLYVSAKNISDIEYDPITDYLYVYDEADKLTIIRNKRVVKIIAANLPDSSLRGLAYNHVSKMFLLGGYDFINVYDSGLNLLHVIKNQNDTNYRLYYSTSCKYLARTNLTGSIEIMDGNTYKSLNILITDSTLKYEVFQLKFSSNDSLLVVSQDNNEVQVWDWRAGKMLKKFKLHSTFVFAVAVSNDGKYFASSSLDSKIILYDLKKLESLCTLYPMVDRGVLTITDSNYYIAPRNCYDGFVFKLNKQIYTPEQFDLIYHRPDLVVKKIGSANDEIIKTYNAAFVKRVRRNGGDEKNNSNNLHLPVIEITGKENLPITTSQNKINLKIHAEDILYNIKSLRIWVNNIPVYGAQGLIIKSAPDVAKDIEVVLQKGTNKIKIAAVNEKGVESLKEFYQIYSNYSDSTVKPKLHLVIISVSKYKDQTHNLTYAAKDGRDIIASFKSKFSTIIIDSFINEKAIKENILDVKNKLMKGTVNDKVIIFVSGHGLLDKKYNFYFATHDVNFQKPEIRGISYEQINDLLDGIPARQKLLLMDACHSGEIDKDAPTQTKPNQRDTIQNTSNDYAQKGSKLLNQRKIKLQNSFDLMQDLFSDMSNSNGAVVISAARGTGYALESSRWNNGVFTYALINGLKNRMADTDYDGSVRLTELSTYVISEVETLTNGNQKPTSRAENLEYDWEVW